MSITHKTSLTETNLAERWALSVKTLQDWRRKGTGPEYLKLGKAIRYPHEVIERYEIQHIEGGLK
jgi:hypothetical protein